MKDERGRMKGKKTSNSESLREQALNVEFRRETLKREHF